MKLSAGVIGAGLALVAGIAAGTAESRGLSYVSCAFDGESGVLSVTERNSEGALVRRVGDRIAARQPDGRGGVEEADCGATPTVHNTDRILYLLTSEGITEATLSLAGGPLAPGRTDEGPTSEIETIVRPSAGAHAPGLVIRGTPGQDEFRAGMIGREAGLNLNAGGEGSEPDVDVTVERFRRVALSLLTGGGDDAIDLVGGAEMTGPLSNRFVFVVPGAGNDSVRATSAAVYVFGGRGTDLIRLGSRRDIAEGGRGADRILTRRGGDLILPGPGRDTVHAGGGKDVVLAATGGTDFIDCGAGRDRVLAGSHDRLRDCERVTRFPERATSHVGFE